MTLELPPFFALATETPPDGQSQSEVIQDTLKLGRLAPFPEEIKDFSIIKIEDPFTTGSKGSFSCSPQVIKNWLRNSPGVVEGKQKVQPDGSYLYVLKTIFGGYGVLKITSDYKNVEFNITYTE